MPDLCAECEALLNISISTHYFHGMSHFVRVSNVNFVCVLQLSYDLTWQKLKEKFSHCGTSSESITDSVHLGM